MVQGQSTTSRATATMTPRMHIKMLNTAKAEQSRRKVGLTRRFLKLNKAKMLVGMPTMQTMVRTNASIYG